MKKTALLRELPSVDELLRGGGLKEALRSYSASLVTEAARTAIALAREGLMAGRIVEVSIEGLRDTALRIIGGSVSPGLVKVVNATGTVLHTNLGRAVLGRDAVKAVRLAAENPTNLELDLETGARGDRDNITSGLIERLTGAEASCVVNNNAAAVLISLNTLAEGKEVVISRGELIEIGGSFRLPEIIRKSGCVLKEVGTTNRTHSEDYRSAITGETALLFKAHRSNFNVVGFTAEVGLKELSAIGREHGLPVVEDLGAGSLVDLSAYGLPMEPVVRERLSYGADCVTFSGDKLLGGPQAGIIAGKKEIIDRIKKNPLKRALRADKLTIAALDATLRLYLRPAELPERLPTLKTLTRGRGEIRRSAKRAAALLRQALGEGYRIELEEDESVVGGGSLPGHTLPTFVVTVSHEEKTPEEIAGLFLKSAPPIIGRIRNDKFILDMRTVSRTADVVPICPVGTGA